MLTDEARNLDSGDELYLLDGVGNRNPANVVTFVSGPHVEPAGAHRKWVALIRLSNGGLGLYNLSDLTPKPPMPVEGETWVKRANTRHRYIAGVTDNFVILKGSKGQPNIRAYVLSLDTFLATYRKLR